MWPCHVFTLQDVAGLGLDLLLFQFSYQTLSPAVPSACMEACSLIKLVQGKDPVGRFYWDEGFLASRSGSRARPVLGPTALNCSLTLMSLGCELPSRWTSEPGARLHLGFPAQFSGRKDPVPSQWLRGISRGSGLGLLQCSQ